MSLLLSLCIAEVQSDLALRTRNRREDRKNVLPLAAADFRDKCDQQTMTLSYIALCL